jgi:hypothetical protein
MRSKRLRLALMASLLMVGCGVTVQAPQVGGGGGTLVEAALSPEAEREFRALDVDPAQDILVQIAATLNITVIVNQDVNVTDGTPKVVLPTNAEQVCHVSQKEENHLPTCATWEVSASSTRNDYFPVSNVRDTNLRSAWAPLENDAHPALTFDLSTEMDLSAMQLKLSPQGVVVDVEVFNDGAWSTVVTGLVPEYRTLDWINLPTTRAEKVRLSFRGPQAGQVLVCHVGLFGPGCDASAAPTTAPSMTPAPSVSPSVTPTVAPSTAPSATPSASIAPSASPSVEPSVEPSAEPTATPSAEPSAEPTATPEETASPAEETSV